MSSEAITRNDLTAILNEVLPSKDVVLDSGRLGATTVNSSAYADVSVTFNAIFTAEPDVVACFVSDSTGATFGRCVCSVHSITTTGFKIRAFNGDTTARSPAFRWIAIGK